MCVADRGAIMAAYTSLCPSRLGGLWLGLGRSRPRHLSEKPPAPRAFRNGGQRKVRLRAPEPLLLYTLRRR